MPKYIRARGSNTYFFTVVTYKRRPFLCQDDVRPILRKAIKDVQAVLPFQVLAMVLLPDHLHTLWQLADGDYGYSQRWGMVKARFTRSVRLLLPHVSGSVSRQRRNEGTVWQRRFWEHEIRDPQDLRNHLDYIHYNPVHHGYVATPVDYQFSTIHRHIKEGACPADWGSSPGIELPPGIGGE